MTVSPRRILALAALGLPLAGCGLPEGTGPDGPIDSLPRALSAAEREVIASSNTFAFGLLREVNAGSREENVFISPLSVSMALGMTMNGAATETFDEMRAALGFGALSQEQINASYRDLHDLLVNLDRQVELGIANAVWYRRDFTFERSFLNAVRRSFGAEIEGLDFAAPSAVTRINDWVSRSTRGRIDEIVQSIAVDDVMILANAVYFKGEWTEAFDPSRTADRPFTGLDGRQITVPMMTNLASFRSARGAEYQAIDLPYGNGAFTMTIVLPSQGTDVNTFIETLDETRWREIVDGLAESRLEVTMPRFRTEYDASLNDALAALGIRRAFIPDGADFTRMSPAGRRLYISDVRHRSYVDVDEVGTEAAAVTSVTITVTSMPPSIVVDRPFVFAIRERFSGAILFSGKIVDPAAGGTS